MCDDVSEKISVDENSSTETNAFRAYLVSACFIIAMNIERLMGDRGSSNMAHLRNTLCSFLLQPARWPLALVWPW